MSREQSNGEGSGVETGTERFVDVTVQQNFLDSTLMKV